jgi:hypothetical protein
MFRNNKRNREKHFILKREDRFRTAVVRRSDILLFYGEFSRERNFQSAMGGLYDIIYCGDRPAILAYFALTKM